MDRTRRSPCPSGGPPAPLDLDVPPPAQIAPALQDAVDDYRAEQEADRELRVQDRVCRISGGSCRSCVPTPGRARRKGDEGTIEMVTASEARSRAKAMIADLQARGESPANIADQVYALGKDYVGGGPTADSVGIHFELLDMEDPVYKRAAIRLKSDEDIYRLHKGVQAFKEAANNSNEQERAVRGMIQIATFLTPPLSTEHTENVNAAANVLRASGLDYDADIMMNRLGLGGPIDHMKAEYGLDEVTPDQIDQAIAGADQTAVADAVDDAIKVNISDNEVWMVLRTLHYGTPGIHFIRTPDGSIEIKESPTSQKRITLPDPKNDGTAKSKRANFGMKSHMERSTKLAAAAEVLRQANLPITRRSLGMMIATIGIDKWTSRMPRPIAARIRGIQHTVALENAVRGLIDPEIYERSKDASGTVFVDRYQRVASGGSALASIGTTNPAVAAFVADDRGPDVREYEHPGEVIENVRNTLIRYGFDKSNWKRVSKLDPASMERIISKPLSKSAATTLLNAIGKYQIQDPTDDQIDVARAIAKQYSIHIRRSISPRREQAERAVGLAMRYDGGWEDAVERKRIIGEVGDYVANRVSRDQPITSTTWNGLVQASERWHRDQVHDEMRRRIEAERARNEGKIRGWNSLVLNTQIERSGTTYTVSPLTDASMLHREGAEMRHCVGSYGGTCYDGQSRIFSIQGDDGEKATVELQKRSGQWTPIQVKGPHNDVVSSGMNQVVKEVSKQYQEAWEATPTEQRSIERWVGPDGEEALAPGAAEPDPADPPAQLDLGDVPPAHVPPVLQEAAADPPAQLDLGDVPPAHVPPVLQEAAAAYHDARVAEMLLGRAAEYRGVPAPAWVRAGRGGRGRLER